MTDDEDYAIQWQTAKLIQIFDTSADDLESNRDPEGGLEECAAFLHSMDDEEKGVTIIDLLVLFCELRSRVLAEKSKKIIEGLQ